MWTLQQYMFTSIQFNSVQFTVLNLVVVSSCTQTQTYIIPVLHYDSFLWITDARHRDRFINTDS